MATLKSIKNKYLQASDGDTLGVDDNKDNIALLAFKMQATDSIAKFDMVDGFLDSFADASGIDDSASTNEIRATSKYYSGGQDGNYFGNGELGDVTFGSSSITQANDTVAIDTKLATGSESGGPGANSFAYSAQGPGPGQDFPWTYTTKYVVNSAATYELTVPNTVGSYDGDMTLAQFNTLTINSGVTLTTKQPGRGLFVFVKGNCVINGSLCMTARGGASNPTTSGGSDSNAVGSAGLQLGFVTSGGSASFTNDGTGFNGAGTGIRTSLANLANLSSNGSIFTIARAGAAGGAGKSGSSASSGNNGSSGSSGATILTGGGGGGSISKDGGGQFGSATSGSGAQGGCFSGGPGGGSASIIWSTGGTAGDGTQYGGAAGYARHSGNAQYYNAGGSAGAPPGSSSGGTNSHTRQRGADGSGGLIWLVVGGNLTIGSGATIEAKGANGGAANSHSNSSGGAGSAGGAIMVLYHGTYSNSGSITTGGGSGGSAQAGGGSGGSGGTHSAQISQPQQYNDLTLVSNSVTATSQPDTADVVATYTNGIGTATINTDLKYWVSRDNGTTYTQCTMVAGGTTGGHSILTHRGLDISGQPDGTTMRYKVTTHNQSDSKETRAQAVSLAWA